MECSEIRDLLPDFYLGNLPPDETQEVERHLAAHPECRDALEEISEVLDLLHFDVPFVRPPPDLKGRVMSGISQGKGRTNGDALRSPPAAGTARKHRPPGDRASRLWRNVLAGALCVALLSLLVVGFLYADLAGENEVLEERVASLSQDGEMFAVSLSDTGQAPEARGTLVLDPADSQVALGVHNLPQPAQGRLYKVWLVRYDGEPVALGVMETNATGDGQMEGSLPGSRGGRYREIEVTSEPRDSTKKNGSVYLRADLTDQPS